MIAYFLAAYLILNGIVFLVYGVDKYKAFTISGESRKLPFLLSLLLV